MAINVRRLCRLNLNLSNNILSKSNFINVGVRSLYSEQDLGVPLYENARYIFRNQFMTIEDTFRSKMKEICEKEDGVIYTEDLKAMLHLVHENDEDMKLLSKMLEKYVRTKEERKITVYAFGPVVMRMFYYLDQPQRALAMFENNELSEHFDYRTSFRILMCLLYKHNMFKEMRDVYDKILLNKGMDFIGNNSVLMYAGCVKENTPEALDYALKQWKDQYDTVKPSLRSSSLVALLALKNNASEVAAEILSVTDRETAISIRCLKMLTYMSLQKYVQIIPLLKCAVESDTSVRQQKFFADVIYELEEKLKSETVPEREEILHLIDDLKKGDLLEMHCTLEEFLLRPMSIPKQTLGRNRMKFASSNNQPKQAAAGLKNYF
ncbi:uncharacterized protein LOC108627654 [Ceratina calcarata]|uniref:Uncharacterized protein LOC108627654 n=1 Tax=Ceratina calcarata TaxID=156304 RepID=A0AAJ7N9J9_9HYME|nr:uncharacterized protein LOC108627654 [Ceratina calcarata]